MKKMFNLTHKDMQMKTTMYHFLLSNWQSFDSIIIPVLAMVWGKQAPPYAIGGNIYYYSLFSAISNTNLNIQLTL